MNLKLITPFLFFLLIINTAFPQEAHFNDNINTFTELKDNLLNPPAKYRTAPFYVWNDEITEQQIDEILTDYHSKGIGGVFIHARPGLITEFISDRWYKLFKYAVEKGKTLGMQIWIYDENTYASGNAGGHVPAQMPEASNQGSAIAIKHWTKFPPQLDKTYFIILKRVGEKFVEITDNYTAEIGKEGDYYACEKKYYAKSAWFAGKTYVDLLQPEVTKKFNETVLKGYKKELKEDFGNTVPGVFTDEPGIYIDDNCWTPAMFTAFQQKWGYDLKLNLPCLNYEIGNWKKVRHDYYSIILDLFIDGFCKPYASYCKKHNLTFTGHFLEHDWPSPAMSPDYMSLQAFEGMPGIDDLFNQYDESVNAQFGNIRMPREVRSVANQMGKTRTLSETYGGAGWDLSFQEMKRIADWQFASGINFVNQHLSQTTIKGWRKRDYPQSFSAHEPWWNLYKNIVDYTARMSLAMSSGKQINSILVLEPTTTAWMYFSKNDKNKKFDELGTAFQNFLNELEKYQIEYDLGSEKNIETHGKAKKGKLDIGQRDYSIIVIPPAFENFDSTTFDKLESFLSLGGKLVSYTQTPSYINGQPTDKVRELAKQYPKQWITYKSIAEQASIKSLSSKAFKVYEPQKIKGKLLHERRKLEDGELILLTNTSKTEWARGRLKVRGESAYEIDASSGNITPYPVLNKGDKAKISFAIPQCGSLLLYVNNEINPAANNNKSRFSLNQITSKDQPTITLNKPNTLTLDYCDLKFTDGTVENDIYVVNAGNKVFKHYGLRDGDPWQNPQYKTQYIDSNKFATNSGFEAIYHVTIEKGVDMSGIQASVEQTNLWKLSVNGHIVEPKPNETWLDRHFGVYDIGAFLKEGNNELKVIATQMTIFSELESIYLIGNFGLEAAEKGFKIIPPKALELGSWRHQGLQMYANSVSYSNTYAIHKENKHIVVALDNWNGSVAEVMVNGQQAGIIYSEPFELDITAKLAEGDNKITVLVYGSLKNLLGPHHIKVRGMAGPGDFATAPQHQPSGSNYSLNDYGLFDNFKVLEVKGEPQKYYRKKDHLIPLQVANPVVIVDKKSSTETTKRIIITDETPDANIYYTSDGRVPSLTSELYKKPFNISKATVIKTFATKAHTLQSNTTTKNIVFGMNIIHAVYKNEYTKYNAGGKEGLFDGEKGSESFSDGKWQGFEGEDMDITFELLKPQKIKKISMGFLENIGVWIYFPVSIEVSVSTDGKDFKKIKTLTKEDISLIAGDPLKEISMQLDNFDAKYIRIFARNIQICPEGDPGAGGKAWIFVDEVSVE
ncbi:MAG: glycosyl hydrolase [Bacteroidota bacterium]